MKIKTSKENNVSLTLKYHPPYNWEKMLNFLAGRAISGVEVVKNGEYMRTAYLITAGGNSVCGWIRVGHKPKKSALSVTISETLLSVLPQVSARVQHLFDLCCDPNAVYETLSIMNTIRPNLCVLGTRLPGCFNPNYALEISGKFTG